MRGGGDVVGRALSRDVEIADLLRDDVEGRLRRFGLRPGSAGSPATQWKSDFWHALSHLAIVRTLVAYTSPEAQPIALSDFYPETPVSRNRATMAVSISTVCLAA